MRRREAIATCEERLRGVCDLIVNLDSECDKAKGQWKTLNRVKDPAAPGMRDEFQRLERELNENRQRQIDYQNEIAMLSRVASTNEAIDEGEEVEEREEGDAATSTSTSFFVLCDFPDLFNIGKRMIDENISHIDPTASSSSSTSNSSDNWERLSWELRREGIPEHFLGGFVDGNYVNEKGERPKPKDVESMRELIPDGYANTIIGRFHIRRGQLASDPTHFDPKIMKTYAMAEIADGRLRKSLFLSRRIGGDHVIKCEGVVRREDGSAAVVFPMVRGGTLTRWAREGRGVLDKLRVLYELSVAVEMLHNRHYVHRDVKPDNVLMTSSSRDASVLLADLDTVKMPRGGHTFLGTVNMVSDWWWL